MILGRTKTRPTKRLSAETMSSIAAHPHGVGVDNRLWSQQRDPRPWPARYGCPVGGLCYLEVVHASDMLNDAVACVIPDVHAEGEVDLGLHGASPTRLALARTPRYLYPLSLRSLPRLLRAPACLAQPRSRPLGPGCTRSSTTA